MKPLRSPITEYDALAGVQVLGGVFAAGAAAASAAPAELLGCAVAGVVFGTFMYLLAYRRFARDAVAEPQEAPAAQVEPTAVARRRGAAFGLVQVVTIVLLGLLTTLGLPAAILIGNGCALLATSRRLRSWERSHGARLLRKPGWRWRDIRARGIMDARDFYVQTAHASPPSGR